MEVAGDGEQIGAKAARPRRRLGRPGADEGLGGEILGLAGIAAEVESEAGELADMASVKLLERHRSSASPPAMSAAAWAIMFGMRLRRASADIPNSRPRRLIFAVCTPP